MPQDRNTALRTIAVVGEHGAPPVELGGEMKRVAHTLGIAALIVAGVSLAQPAPPSQPTAQQRVAMLKTWLAQSQAQLRSYQWVETTVVAKSGEEKSRKIETCYYGVDGA